MSKKIILRDKQIVTDVSSFNTFGKRNRVIFKDPITGESLLEVHNKVVISGSQKTACDHFDIDPWVALPTYNTSLGLDNAKAFTNFSDIPDDPVTSKRQRSRITLFCCGTGGCGSETSQVYDVKYTDRIAPENLIPFKYQLIADNDLDAEARGKYFGKKTSSNYYAYYFKEFEGTETKQTPYMRYEDGTNIDENLYSSSISMDAETYVELNLQITKDDFRDYFIATSTNGINDAKINQISLCTAWREKELDSSGNATGYYVYQDIIPMTLLNIPNEPLIDLTKGIDITYQVFY